MFTCAMPPEIHTLEESAVDQATLLTACLAIKISMPLAFPGMNAKECIYKKGMLNYAASLSHACQGPVIASKNFPCKNRSVEKQEFQLLQ